MRAKLARQACEPCRRRKVRCDGAIQPPCANCRTADLQCEFSQVKKKRGPKPRSSHDPAGIRQSLSKTPETASANGPRLAPPPDSSHVRPPRCLGDPGALKLACTLRGSLEEMGLRLEETLSRCIDAFMMACFPTAPIINLPMVYESVPLVLSEPPIRSQEAAESIEERTGGDIADHDLADMRAFVLLTSICAIAARYLPAPLDSIAKAGIMTRFLTASQDMLNLVEDWDIKHANASSIAIRICQAASHHNLGNTRRAFYALGNAIRLATELRIFDETSYKGLPRLEAKLRRIVFGCLSMSDKSAFVLSNRPLTFHEICLNELVATPVILADDFKLLPNNPTDNIYEDRLMQGFYTMHKLWDTAMNILLDIHMVSRLIPRSSPEAHPAPSLNTKFVCSYLVFCGIPDTLASWLRNPNTHVAETEDATMKHRRTFWQQRADIVVTYHVLRLIILRRVIEKGLCSLIGLTDQPEMLALRKTEIASDMVTSIADIPFEVLVTNGEPMVEKLRQIGVTLLEVSNENDMEPVSTRAQILLSTIIDIVARLDSRVSDELSGVVRLPTPE